MKSIISYISYVICTCQACITLTTSNVIESNVSHRRLGRSPMCFPVVQLLVPARMQLLGCQDAAATNTFCA